MANVARAARFHPTPSVGFVYFVQAGEGGLIKIGWAIEPASRVKELQIGSPVILKIIGATEGTMQLERELHRRLKHLRQHGEWFRPTDEVREVMVECGAYGAAGQRHASERERHPFTEQGGSGCANCGSKFAATAYSLVTGLCKACDELRVIREAGIDPLRCTRAEERRIPRILHEYRQRAEDAFIAA